MTYDVDWNTKKALEEAGIEIDDWEHACRSNNLLLQRAVNALARTLDKYEQPPIDPDLIWARQWALNTYYSGIGVDNLVLGGSKDADACVQAAYSIRKACREEWGDR